MKIHLNNLVKCSEIVRTRNVDLSFTWDLYSEISNIIRFLNGLEFKENELNLKDEQKDTFEKAMKVFIDLANIGMKRGLLTWDEGSNVYASIKEVNGFITKMKTN